MENNRTQWKKANEREVQLIDVIWQIAYSWRKVFICTLLCGLALASLRYVKDIQNKNKKTEPVDIQGIEENFTKEERIGLESAEILRKQIEKREEYRASSVEMNLDAYAKNVVVLQYYVDTHYAYNMAENIIPDKAKDIIALYKNYVSNGAMQNRLIENISGNMDTAYIGELISVEKVSSIGIDTEANIFTLYIAGKSKEDAEQLAEGVVEILKEYQTEVADKLGSHDLILTDRHSTLFIDRELANKQKALDDEIKRKKTELDTLVDAFSGNQLLVWNEERSLENTDIEEVPENNVQTATFSFKYVILGGFCGAVLCCALILCKYLFSNKLKTAQELLQMYNVSMLGKIAVEKEKKKILPIVDRWLDLLHCKKKLTADEEWGMNLTKLKMLCHKNQVQHIFAISTVPFTEKDKNWIDKWVESLKKFGIQVTFGGNVIADAEKFEEMTECGYVVLIEKVDVSRYSAMEQELLLCSEQQINILGALVLEQKRS